MLKECPIQKTTKLKEIVKNEESNKNKRNFGCALNF